MTNAYDAHPRVFGEEPSVISGITIITDTNNTGELAEAYYGDIVFMKRPEQ